jgi:transcriptional regulator with XRE-family HTH domain
MDDNLRMAFPKADLGSVVKRHRENRGLSQDSLAELAGISRNHLGEIERAESSPSIEILAKISKALCERLSILIAECEEGQNEE